eukprot:TRINITY_DN73708_c0_g1_i1.p2 TRINITY_DN73708_c0_g1~~TRINITY_DN73708_c0_g1_i1.p2  ORF type:complete len:110 (+),score=20.57 TRINITY_DN73708_c0_g1_i1:50-379(+)
MQRATAAVSRVAALNARSGLTQLKLRSAAQAQVIDLTIGGLSTIGAGSAAIGTGASGVGVGAVMNGYLVAAARQPSMSGTLFGYALVGVALCEGLGLISLVVAMMLLFS